MFYVEILRVAYIFYKPALTHVFKVFTFMWKLFKQLELYGKALKIVVKHHEDKRTKETEKIVVEILECLGWQHVVR